MRRPAVLTFISSKRRRATRRAIFPSTSSHTLSVLSHDPDTTVPFDRTATTHWTCAPRGVDERSTRCSTGRRRRAGYVCPVSVRRHSLLDTSHTLSVRSHDPDTTRPFDSATRHWTCAPRGRREQSTARFDWTPAPRCVRVPAQRRHAAEARKGSHGLRNKCSNTVIAFILRESHSYYLNFQPSEAEN